MCFVFDYLNRVSFTLHMGDHDVAVSGPRAMKMHDRSTCAKLKTSLFSLPMLPTSDLTREIIEKKKHNVTLCRTKNGENDTVVHFIADSKKQEDTAKRKDENVDG